MCQTRTWKQTPAKETSTWADDLQTHLTHIRIMTSSPMRFPSAVPISTHAMAHCDFPYCPVRICSIQVVIAPPTTGCILSRLASQARALRCCPTPGRVPQAPPGPPEPATRRPDPPVASVDLKISRPALTSAVGMIGVSAGSFGPWLAQPDSREYHCRQNASRDQQPDDDPGHVSSAPFGVQAERSMPSTSVRV